MTLTMPLSRDSVQWLCRWIVALHTNNHLQNNLLHRYEDVIFSVSRSPFIAKKYGHLLGERQGEEGDCDQDGGDTQVGPLHPLTTDLHTVQASPQHSPVPDPAMFFLRRRQLVKYAEHDRNFYDSTRMLNFKVCLRLQISNSAMYAADKLLVVCSAPAVAGGEDAGGLHL